MNKYTIAFFIVLALTAFCYADTNELVLVDTVYAEPAPLTGTIIYNIDYHTYSFYPNLTALYIGYGRYSFDTPGIQEARAFITFPLQNIPIGYYLFSAEIQLYCLTYMDNSDESEWPHYYSTPYPVNVDHLQYETIAPSVFNQTSLESNIAVLQNNAFLGWVSTEVTNSYLDDVQQARAFSQYRLRFPAGYDVSGYEVDEVIYARVSWGTPKLLLTYHKTVANSDQILPVQSELINQIYPQPANNILNIELTGKNYPKAELSIYDVKGRLVHLETNMRVQSGLIHIPIQDYPSGIYFIRYRTIQQTEIKKVIILK
jgi:hypothetical protein